MRCTVRSKNDWHGYKDWAFLKMDFTETEAVCDVLAAYLGKDRPSR
ncbi:MAG: hypothetical protein ACXWIF_08135 [Pyrinomonadaceae bacterium]